MPQRDWISTSEVEVTGTKRRKAARRSTTRFLFRFVNGCWLGTRGRGEVTQHTRLLRSQYASHSRRDYHYRKIAQFICSPRNLVFLPPFQPNFPLVPMPISVDGSQRISKFQLPRSVLLQHALKRPSPPRIRLYAQKHAFTRLPTRHHRDVLWLQQYVYGWPASLAFLTRSCSLGRFGAPYERSAGRLFGARVGGRSNECVLGGFYIPLMLTSPITVVPVVPRVLFCEAVAPCVVEFTAPPVRVAGFDDLSVLTRPHAPPPPSNTMSWGSDNRREGQRARLQAFLFRTCPYTK